MCYKSCYKNVTIRSTTYLRYFNVICIFFFFDPRKAKSNEGKSEYSHYWICWRCVEQMIAQLSPRKNCLGSGGPTPPITAIVAGIFSLFPSPSSRIVERTKFTVYKALVEKVSRAQSSHKLLHFHLALRLPKRNT